MSDSDILRIVASQASLSTISRNLLQLMSIESVRLSNHLILCRALLLLPSIFPSIRVFSNNWALCIRFPLWLSWQRICLQCRRPGFDPSVGKIPWRRERLPTPVCWPGEFHGLVHGVAESDTTEQLSLHFTLGHYYNIIFTPTLQMIKLD